MGDQMVVDADHFISVRQLLLEVRQVQFHGFGEQAGRSERDRHPSQRDPPLQADRFVGIQSDLRGLVMITYLQMIFNALAAKIKRLWAKLLCLLFVTHCWHCEKCDAMLQSNDLAKLVRKIGYHNQGHRVNQAGADLPWHVQGRRGSTWLNGTDILVNPEAEDPDDRIILRQVGWQGHSGRFYAMGERPSHTEPGGYGPIFRFRGD
jgi:hypothetical protein